MRCTKADPKCMGMAALGDCTCRPLADPLVRAEKAEALLRRCRPFVLRAMNKVNIPHVQDIEDAEALWPLLKYLSDWEPTAQGRSARTEAENG